MRVIKFSEIVIMAESAFGMYLVKKRNTKSNVWQNFALMATEDGKIVEKEQDKPICRSCGKGVLAKGSNTTNLFQHLREHHPLVFAELAPPQSSKSKSTAEAEPSSKQATLAETISSLPAHCLFLDIIVSIFGVQSFIGVWASENSLLHPCLLR